MSLCHLPLSTLLLILATCTQIAAQTCQSETAVPATTPAAASRTTATPR